MLVSYHTHSVMSDGKAEIIDLVRAASETELTELGISDHYVITPDGKELEWSMPLGALDEYVETVQCSAGEAREDLIVRLGLEVDFFPETKEKIREVLFSQPFDFVIGSVHLVDGFSVDDTADLWHALTPAERDDVFRTYWVRVRELAESGLFDIMGHIDLPKKFGFTPTIDLTEEIDAAVSAIARAEMVVELNTAGWYLPAGEAYPSVDILRKCKEMGIPMIVSSDAHTPENLLRGYDRGYDLLREIGYSELIAFAGRMHMPYSIVD